MSNYFDKRTDFFKRFYEAALPYDAYLKTGEPTHQERWHTFDKEIRLTEREQEVIRSWKRTLNILVLSGIWCGDCARQGPMFRRLEQASPLLSFRYLDNKQNPELQNELRIHGAEKVPVIVCLSEDFFELCRFGDKHLSAYRRQAAAALGPACDPGIIPPSEDVLTAELRDWVEFFDRIQLLLRLSPMLRKRYND